MPSPSVPGPLLLPRPPLPQHLLWGDVTPVLLAGRRGPGPLFPSSPGFFGVRWPSHPRALPEVLPWGGGVSPACHCREQRHSLGGRQGRMLGSLFQKRSPGAWVLPPAVPRCRALRGCCPFPKAWLESLCRVETCRAAPGHQTRVPQPTGHGPDAEMFAGIYK